MPHVKFDTPTGNIELEYSIATPSTPSSGQVDAHLPCILFLHAGWIGKEVFESELSLSFFTLYPDTTARF